MQLKSGVVTDEYQGSIRLANLLLSLKINQNCC